MDRNLDDIINVIFHSSDWIEEELKSEYCLNDLTSRQLYCIELIKNLKNPTLSELAEGMSITKASMTVMIDRLEKNGYVYKTAADNDRRVAHVHLTKNGEKASQLHSELHRKIGNLLILDMTESEKEILMVLLNKSVTSLSKYKKHINS